MSELWGLKLLSPAILVLMGIIVGILFDGFARQLQQSHPVSWFLANPAALAQAYAWCKDNPGSSSAECSSANEAKLQADIQAFTGAVKNGQ